MNNPLLKAALDEQSATRMTLLRNDPTPEDVIALATAAMQEAKDLLLAVGGRPMAIAVFAEAIKDIALAPDKPTS